MKRLLSYALLLTAPLAIAATSHAQAPSGEETAPLYIGSEWTPLRVTTLAVYQHYDDNGTTVSQVTLPVSVFVPVTPDVGFSLRTGYASSDGSGMTTISGFADAQLALSHNRTLGPGSAVASISVNLPSGDGTLTQAESETAFLVGQGFYRFRLPSLGQGFNVAPGLTWAVPLGVNYAAGVGVAYQYRGPFEPRAELDDSYDPGDELLVTAGLDARVSESSTIAVDVSYAHYQADTWMGLDYTTGDAITLTAQWTEVVGPHEVSVLGRVRHKEESTVPAATSAFLGLDATVPDQGRLLGHARFRVSSRLRIGALVQGRFYSESAAFDARTLYDVGLVPEFDIARGLTLLGRIGGTFGTLQGINVGGGLAWSM